MDFSLSQVLSATEGVQRAGPKTARFTSISTDTRTLASGDLFVALRGDTFDGHRFIAQAIEKGAGALVVDTWPDSESSPVPIICVKDTLTALGDLAHQLRLLQPIPAIAITGTSGKTSTKNLIRDCLQTTYRVLATEGNFNNLIGLPKTLFRMHDDDEVAVLEMGMNRFGEIRRMMDIAIPQYGLITNIGVGHTEGVGGIEGVMRAKGELIEGLGDGGYFFANAEDERVMALLDDFDGDVMTYGLSPECDVSAHAIRASDTGLIFEVKTPWDQAVVKSSFYGTHQILNALAAIAVAESFQVSLAHCVAVIEKTVADPGRGRVVKLPSGALLLDDAYNANPVSAHALLSWFTHVPSQYPNKVLVFGTMKELGEQALAEHLRLIRACPAAGITELYLYGEFAEAMRAEALKAGYAEDALYVIEDLLPFVDTLRLRVADGRTALAIKASHSCGFESLVSALLPRA